MTKRTLMAVGAHADDIEIYVGGTLLKYGESGYDIVYVMATNNMSGCWTTIDADGNRVRHYPPYDQMLAQRRKEADQAARESFGTEAIYLDHPQRHYTDHEGNRVNLTYGAPRPDCVAPDTPSILMAHEDKASCTKLAELILTHNPEAVMTHGPVMVDMEHVGTCLLVSKAYREAVAQGYEGMLLHWLDVTPALPVALFGRRFCGWDTHVDVSPYWERKLASIDHHASVITRAADVEFPEWGPACGCDYAETFTVPAWGKMPAYTSALARELATNLR